MYEVQLIGRLGRDAEVKEWEHGSYVTFAVAHDERRREGEKQTTWVYVRYGIKEGSTLPQYLTKGTLVYIKGKPGAFVADDNDKSVIRHSILAYQLEIVGGGAKKEGDGGGKPRAQYPYAQQAVKQMEKAGFELEDDPPF